MIDWRRHGRSAAYQTLCYVDKRWWLNVSPMMVKRRRCWPDIKVTFVTMNGSRHEILNLCWLNVGPPSTTADQHWPNISSTFCVYWGVAFPTGIRSLTPGCWSLTGMDGQVPGQYVIIHPSLIPIRRHLPMLRLHSESQSSVILNYTHSRPWSFMFNIMPSNNEKRHTKFTILEINWLKKNIELEQCE